MKDQCWMLTQKVSELRSVLPNCEMFGNATGFSRTCAYSLLGFEEVNQTPGISHVAPTCPANSVNTSRFAALGLCSLRSWCNWKKQHCQLLPRGTWDTFLLGSHWRRPAQKLMIYFENLWCVFEANVQFVHIYHTLVHIFWFTFSFQLKLKHRCSSGSHLTSSSPDNVQTGGQLLAKVINLSGTSIGITRSSPLTIHLYKFSFIVLLLFLR